MIETKAQWMWAGQEEKVEKIVVTCDAPGCSKEILEGDEMRLIEVTTWITSSVTSIKSYACSIECEAGIYRYREHDIASVFRGERGWYVLLGKRGFDGAGWFESREAARQGLERDCLGPFSSVYSARHARGGDQPDPPRGETLRDLVRLLGVAVTSDAVRSWNVEQRCEVEAWAAFTLSDRQLGCHRAPPEPLCLAAARVGKKHDVDCDCWRCVSFR